MRKTPKEWQPLKKAKQHIIFPLSSYYPLLFHTANGVNNYIAKKKRLRKRGGKKQTNVSGAVLSIYFHKKWITPYLIKVNKGSWNFCWCDTLTKNKTLLKNNINFNKKPRVLKKKKKIDPLVGKKGEQSCTSPSRTSRIFISIYKKKKKNSSEGVFFLTKNCEQRW